MARVCVKSVEDSKNVFRTSTEKAKDLIKSGTHTYASRTEWRKSGRVQH